MNGIAGSANTVTMIPGRATSRKLKASNGQVASMADHEIMSIIKGARTIGNANGAHQDWPGDADSGDHLGMNGCVNAIPAMATKLSWNDTRWTISGEMTVIRPALKASAGRMLPGRSTPTASRYTLPITAALTTDGGIPETST